jgi:hypothetical protein
VRLKLVRPAHRGGHLSGLVTLRSVIARLAVGGQKPYDLALGRALSRTFARLSSSVRVLVMGTAHDMAGHSTSLTRAFLIKR